MVLSSCIEVDAINLSIIIMNISPWAYIREGLYSNGFLSTNHWAYIRGGL